MSLKVHSRLHPTHHPLAGTSPTLQVAPIDALDDHVADDAIDLSGAITSPPPLQMAAVAATEGLSLDPGRTRVPFSRVEDILSRTAAQAHLHVLDAKDPNSAHAARAGALTLGELYVAFARAHFGRAHTQPITYAKLKRVLDERGLGGEWRAMMEALPASLREQHLKGTATPRDLFLAWAADRASWRAGVRPLSLEQVTHALTLEGKLPDLVRAQSLMTPGQRARLEAGVLTPAQVVEILQDATTREADVIVVGAGMAGLAAANALMAQGLSVVVLEANGHVGGRTKDARVAGARFDAGAAWIHATDENPLTPIIKERGFKLVAHDASLLGYGGSGTPQAQGLEVGKAIEEAQTQLERAAHNNHDVAASEVLRSNSPWAQHAHNTVGPLTMGAESTDYSAADAGSAPAEEHGSASDHTPDQFIEEGWQTVVQSFAHGVPVRLNAPVANVKWGADGVVVDAGGVKFRGKQIVMTASTGVLASGKIGWDPPLPLWKREAFEQVPMVTFDKIALRFDKNIFDGVEPGAFVYELKDHAAMDVLIRPKDENVVVALIGGATADKLRAQGEVAQVEALLAKLERIYGPQVREHVVGSTVTSWRDDPFSMGSFTAAKPGYARARAKLAKPVDDIVFFAGEANSVRWGGMVPGAWLTGTEAGEQIGQLAPFKDMKRKLTSLRPAPSPHLADAHP